MYILVYSVYLLEIQTNMWILCGQDLRKENKHPIQISVPTLILSMHLQYIFLYKQIVSNKK